MKTLKIEIPNGYEIDMENPIHNGHVVFKEIEKELPKTWQELERLTGVYVDSGSNVLDIKDNRAKVAINRNIFATKEQAEASINLSMYSQLLQAYKDVSITEFMEIAKEYEPKVRPILELFFGEYAEAAFYYGLLSKLRDEYRKGWKPDYTMQTQNKWIIRFYKGKLVIEDYCSTNYFLSFQYKEIASQFLENFSDLIEKAKPLMS